MLQFVSRLTRRTRNTLGATLLTNRVVVQVFAEHLCARLTQLSTLWDSLSVHLVWTSRGVRPHSESPVDKR